jgi:hypothetical protein
MICEPVTVETGDTKFSRRFGLRAEGQLKALPKSQAKECRNCVKAETMHLRMIDRSQTRTERPSDSLGF